MHIIALDRLTEPSDPILFTEILEKTHTSIKNINFRTSLTNVMRVNNVFQCVCDLLQHSDVCQ